MNNDIDITELDEAELRHEIRELYNDIGFDGVMSALNEMMIYSRVTLEVLKEEYENSRNDNI